MPLVGGPHLEIALTLLESNKSAHYEIVTGIPVGVQLCVGEREGCIPNPSSEIKVRQCGCIPLKGIIVTSSSVYMNTDW